MIHQQLPRDLHRVEHYQNLAREAVNDDGSFDACSARTKAWTLAYLSVVAWLMLGAFGFGVWLVFSGDAVPARAVALRAEPQASQAKPLIAIAGDR